jgi:hypothetical protein
VDTLVAHALETWENFKTVTAMEASLLDYKRLPERGSSGCPRREFREVIVAVST